MTNHVLTMAPTTTTRSARNASLTIHADDHKEDPQQQSSSPFHTPCFLCDHRLCGRTAPMDANSAPLYPVPSIAWRANRARTTPITHHADSPQAAAGRAPLDALQGVWNEQRDDPDSQPDVLRLLAVPLDERRLPHAHCHRPGMRRALNRFLDSAPGWIWMPQFVIALIAESRALGQGPAYQVTILAGGEPPPPERHPQLHGACGDAPAEPLALGSAASPSMCRKRQQTIAAPPMPWAALLVGPTRPAPPSADHRRQRRPQHLHCRPRCP